MSDRNHQLRSPDTNHPLDVLQLTDDGVAVPPWYVGYSGTLTVIDSRGRIDIDIPDALGEYDDRLLTEFGILPSIYDEEYVTICPWDDPTPTRVFEVVDDRSTAEDDEYILTDSPYQAFISATALASELGNAIHRNRDLEVDDRLERERITHGIEENLYYARVEVLPSDDPGEFGGRIMAYDHHWEHYHDAFGQLETKLQRLDAAIADDDGLTTAQETNARTEVRMALSRLADLQQLFPEEARSAYRSGEEPDEKVVFAGNAESILFDKVEIVERDDSEGESE